MAKVKLPKWCTIVRSAPAVYERDVFAANVAILSPSDAARVLRPRLTRQDVEQFVVLCLNAQYRMICAQVVTSGILDSSLVHPREVFRVAVVMGAYAVIVAHNHPSGDPTPSLADRNVTDQLVAAGKILDIPVHDHIIIGAGDRYTSFAQAGLL